MYFCAVFFHKHLLRQFQKTTAFGSYRTLPSYAAGTLTYCKFADLFILGNFMEYKHNNHFTL